ncbi:hypothetical protein CYQ60_13395, partial [Enterococcus faecium]
LPTVTLIPNGIHHPPIEDGRLLPNSVKKAKNGQMEAKALSSVPLLMKSDRTPTCRKKCVRLFAVKQ